MLSEVVHILITIISNQQNQPNPGSLRTHSPVDGAFAALSALEALVNSLDDTPTNSFSAIISRRIISARRVAGRRYAGLNQHRNERNKGINL